VVGTCLAGEVEVRVSALARSQATRLSARLIHCRNDAIQEAQGAERVIVGGRGDLQVHECYPWFALLWQAVCAPYGRGMGDMQGKSRMRCHGEA